MADCKIARSTVQNLDLFDKYTCPHCHHLCKDAVQSVCGHWLCESCADELMATSSPKCPRPDCQEDLSSDGDKCFPDRFVRKEIAKMIVLCPYEGNGCQWEDKTADLEAHLKTCTFASDVTCPLASLGCQHSQTGTKEELQKHIAECGPEHLQLIADILSLLRPLLPSALSSESASVVERDGVLTSKGSKTQWTGVLATSLATGYTVGSSSHPVSAGVQRLMDNYQLTTSQVNREIQQKDIPYLAVSFDNVELYVDAMELSPGEQTDVHRKPHTHIAMIECLRIWKRKKLSQATFWALLEMLVKLKKETIANQICQYIKEMEI